MSGVERTALLDPPPPESGSQGALSPASAAAGSAAHNQAIATGVVWQGALRWLVQILSWTATLVIARKLSPEDYGIAGTATVLVGLVSQLTKYFIVALALHQHGATYAEAAHNGQEVLEMLIEVYREDGKPLPEPRVMRDIPILV